VTATGEPGEAGAAGGVATAPNARTLDFNQRKLIHDSTAPRAKPAPPRHPQCRAAHSAPAAPRAMVNQSIRRSVDAPKASGTAYGEVPCGPPGSWATSFVPRHRVSSTFPCYSPDHLVNAPGKSHESKNQSECWRGVKPLVRQITGPGTDNCGAHEHKRQIHGIAKLAQETAGTVSRWRRRIRISVVSGQRARRARSANM
jgi:hypothetical protein